MFEIMLGLDSDWALIITTVVLLTYVVLGGAHADILTDGAQGALMLILAVIVIILTLIGYGVEGGFSGMIDDLQRQDPELTTALNTQPALPLMVVHLRHRLCPYAARIASPLRQQIVGLKDQSQRFQFVKLAALFGVTLGCWGLEGCWLESISEMRCMPKG